MLDRPLEHDYWDQNQSVLGMDEAGRGPIAGPLMVAGVIFPKGYHNELIDDSKKLSEKKREALFKTIIQDALYYQILVVDEKTIDKKNIYRATQEAMMEIANKAQCDFVLSDAMPLTFSSYRKGRSKIIIHCGCKYFSKSNQRSLDEKTR